MNVSVLGEAEVELGKFRICDIVLVVDIDDDSVMEMHCIEQYQLDPDDTKQQLLKFGNEIFRWRSNTLLWKTIFGATLGCSNRLEARTNPC